MLPFLKFVASIFFERRYISGKYFESSNISGWKWLLRSIFWQKIIGINRHLPWPVSPFVTVSNAQNIIFNSNDINNFQTFGSYFQNFKATIHIGEGTYIAPNVGIITANHDPCNLEEYLDAKDVIIGEKCWIGMNAIILPGVELGSHTIVGAGSVVTKSFPEGNVIIAGNPAKIIRKI
jgi:acetyltransferase-like isoleucine patch superfamily enzyme